jgi:hypothetical protein
VIRLNMVVEGQTEEAFSNRVLVPHFSSREIFPAAQLISRKKSTNSRVFKGGLRSYSAVKSHLLRWMRSDPSDEVWFTTMLDLYALPDDFPGYTLGQPNSDPYERVTHLENSFGQDMAEAGIQRFIPYIQLHEFEALLLVEPRALDWEFLEHERAIIRLEALAKRYDSPEEIDEGPDTAPSKRIIHEIPEYAFVKASAGPLVADKIGLTALRQACRHFDEWIGRIEILT